MVVISCGVPWAKKAWRSPTFSKPGLGSKFLLLDELPAKDKEPELPEPDILQVTWGAFHLVKISGISGSVVNGTRFVGSSHWKIPRKTGKSKQVGPFSRLEFPTEFRVPFTRFS